MKLSSPTNTPLVIFDCDGILVDSESLASSVFSEHLQKLGLLYSADDCEKHFRGLSLATCRQRIEHKHQQLLPPDFFEQLQTATFARFANSLQPVPGVIEVLDYLDNQGWHYCVASSGDYTKMHFTLGHTGLLHRFDAKLFSAVDVQRGKPAPDLFLHAAQAMGYTNQQCIVIEDSMPGIEAAIAAGMQVCGYRSPARNGSIPFSDMAELPDILRTLT